MRSTRMSLTLALIVALAVGVYATPTVAAPARLIGEAVRYLSQLLSGSDVADDESEFLMRVDHDPGSRGELEQAAPDEKAPDFPRVLRLPTPTQ